MRGKWQKKKEKNQSLILFLLTNSGAALEVEFRSEARYGDSLRALCAADPAEPEVLHHSLRRTEDDQEVVRGRTRWLPVSKPA